MGTNRCLLILDLLKIKLSLWWSNNAQLMHLCERAIGHLLNGEILVFVSKKMPNDVVISIITVPKHYLCFCLPSFLLGMLWSASTHDLTNKNSMNRDDIMVAES